MESGYIVSTKYDGKKRKLYPHTCKVCGKIKYAPSHRPILFCSAICRAISNGTSLILNCALCKKEFVRGRTTLRNSKSGLVFCGRLCKEISQRIDGGMKEIQPEHYGKEGSSAYRKIAKREHGLDKCSRCGYNKVSAILQVHHRDRNRLNSSPSNLEVVCPNCHMEDHYLNKDGLYSHRT